jgi:hypothetical protein
MSQTTMHAFAEVRLWGVLEGQQQKVLHEIQNEPPHKLLNVNESDYVAYLADKYRVQPIVFEFGALQVSHAERMIPIEQHPLDFAWHRNPLQKDACLRQVVIFHIPFTGETELLRCQPSTSLFGRDVEIEVSGKEIRFGLINWRNDAQQLKNEQSAIADQLRKQSEYLAADVQKFNSHLEGQVRQAVSARRAQLLSQLKLVESLGIPMRKAASIPQTFAVPVVPKKVLVKPSAPDAAYSPHPTLDLATYNDIVSIIHETGTAMERHPSTYRDKQECSVPCFFRELFPFDFRAKREAVARCCGVVLSF